MDIANDGLYAPAWSSRVGSFQFYFADDRWGWADQIERMRGYLPGTTRGSGTELAPAHVHPDDCQPVADTMYDARHAHRPFSSRHRMLDARNRTHDVVMIGAPFRDLHGAAVGMRGYFLNITPADTTVRTTHAPDENAAARLRTRAENGHSDAESHRIRAATRC
jgi:hypothetical protein